MIGIYLLRISGYVSSRNLKGYLTELLFFGDFDSEASCRSSVFVRAITMWLVISPSASLPTHIGIFGRFGAETDSSDQLDKNDFPSFIMLVSSVLGFRPWCSSNGVFFSPVCIVNRITFNALFTLSVILFPSSILANTRFFIVCIALSTVPFPVCILGGQYCISMFRALQNSLYSVEVNAPPLSDLIFPGMPYKLNWFDRKLITSFVSDVLQIFAVGHLLNRSIAINICGSPFRFYYVIFR